MKMTYSEQLRHPYWQRKRLEALNAADFSCTSCYDGQTTLNVHHKQYVKGRMAWEYELRDLEVLCEPCHLAIHKDRAMLEGEIAALEHFEYLAIHDLLLGRRGALISRVAPDEYVDAQLSSDEQAYHSYLCGELVSAFQDLDETKLAFVERAFQTLNPDGFIEALQAAMPRPKDPAQ